MKLLVLLILMLGRGLSFANEIKIELNPPRPVAGEVFQVYFRIFTDSSEAPAINFSPSGVEVVDKSNQGVSTRTVYANGKLSVTREMTFVYDMVSSKTGTAALRDINVQIDGKIIKHPPINIQVLKEPLEVPEVFIQADVPKTNLYLGEGVLVRYYVYHKVPATSIDIKKFPKLDNFLKRFLQEQDRPERVAVEGQIYTRQLIYSAKLFPEKIGDLKIDSISAAVTYASGASNDPFARFGLGRNLKTKTIQSDTIKVHVVSLPEPVPSNYIGLVGKHDVQIQFGQTRLIVNEPLEFTLTISGDGGLENLEAPEILKQPGLEAFESNGDLKLTNAELATKTFAYTFLAKDNFQAPARVATLSYFDPDLRKYTPVQLNIPEIVVAGGRAVEPKQEGSREDQEGTKSKPKETNTRPDRPIELAGPLTNLDVGINRWLPYINMFLAVMAFSILLGWFIKYRPSFHFGPQVSIPKEFKSGSFTLGDFAKWLTPVIQSTGKTPLKVLEDSPLTQDAKSYFIELLQASEAQDYSIRRTQLQFTYRAIYFKELGRYIMSYNNENSSPLT